MGLACFDGDVTITRNGNGIKSCPTNLANPKT